MRKSKIKAKVETGEAALLVQLHLTDPAVYELASLMGFDGLWMDLEHHAYSVETAAGLIRAARVGNADIMARPGKGEFMRMARLLEVGATGIMYPRCESAEEAAEVVSWCKFAPAGQRGFDGSGPDMPYCTMPMAEYVREANEETFVVIQLESHNAVSQAHEIAAVDGVDYLFLGQADFSVLGGFPGDFNDPRIREALETVAGAAAEAGKRWGTTAPGAEGARELVDKGASLICHNADIVILRNALVRMQEQFRDCGFSFDARR